jgi:hypothetical protein
MNALINSQIQPRSFEVIRDQIGAILAVELKKQCELIGNLPDYKVTVWVERFIPFDHTDYPAVNVMLARGVFSGQTAIQADGTYTYNIDAHTKGKSNSAIKGDVLSMKRLQKIIGWCMAILNDPQYLCLGFHRPFIMSSRTGELIIADPEAKDTEAVAMGRLSHNVKAPETYELSSPPMLAGNETIVKLVETEFGYKYIFPEEQ